MQQVERSFSSNTARNGATASGRSKPNRTTSAGGPLPTSNKATAEMSRSRAEDPVSCTDPKGSSRRAARKVAKNFVKKVAKIKDPAKAIARDVRTYMRPGEHMVPVIQSNPDPVKARSDVLPGERSQFQPSDTPLEDAQDNCFKPAFGIRTSHPIHSRTTPIERVQASAGKQVAYHGPNVRAFAGTGQKSTRPQSPKLNEQAGEVQRTQTILQHRIKPKMRALDQSMGTIMEEEPFHDKQALATTVRRIYGNHHKTAKIDNRDRTWQIGK
jgi:hypothetical protein